MTRIHQTVNASYSLLSWVIRLHLAQYCVTGKYPTILHRVVGLQHTTTEKRERSSLMKDTPTTSNVIRLVGLVIGMQFTVSTTRSIMNWLARKVSLAFRQQQQNHSLPAGRNTMEIFGFRNTANTRPATANKSSSCAICRGKRTDAAAPSSCGHVFCWNCLIQWVTTVRPECPLCRTQCRPQDVLPLYHYDGPLRETENE